MNKNMAFWDRAARYLLGLGLLTWAMIGGPFWCYFGLYPLATASWGVAPLYFILNVDRKRTTRRT